MSKIANPKNEQELSALVKDAYSSNARLSIQGGGTRPIGNPFTADKVLSANKISGISLYEPGALTIVVNAGTPVDEVQKTLAKENQHLPFEPSDFQGLLRTTGAPTIGSVVATANSGPRRIKVGAARDALIGVRFVNGEGEIIKNGGRVMKNVTGYDLVKLMCGSYGTLGVLTELSFKVLPKPETSNCLLIEGLDDASAINALSIALGSPFDVSGAAHIQKGVDGSPVTMVRIEGFENSVKYRSEQLKELIASEFPSAIIQIEKNQNKVAKGWKWVRDVEGFAGKEGAIWRLSVKPTDGPKVVADIEGEVDLEALYDWGGGLVWLLTPNSNNASHEIIRSKLEKYKGHATLIKASEETLSAVDVFQPENPRIAKISNLLRQKFDPSGILNSGVMQKI